MREAWNPGYQKLYLIVAPELEASIMNAVHSVAEGVQGHPLVRVLPTLSGDAHDFGGSAEVDLEPLVAVIASR